MHKMLKKLPAFKALILRSIESCINYDQLEVCWDFIDLFKSRYSGWIHPLELANHLIDLENAYLQKTSSLLISSVK